MKLKKMNDSKKLIVLFFLFAVICLIFAVISPDRADMLGGLVRINTQSGQTVKSYFDPTYGGFSGAFLNVALVCFACAALYCLPGAKADGTSALAFWLTAGFAFWGTTILNIWFSMLGVVLYALIKKKPISSMVNAMLFSTGIGPLITEMLFRYPGTEWHGFTVGGVLGALAVGIFIGLVLCAGLGHSPNTHKGYSLYSAAVPIGLTAFFLRALLFKAMGGNMQAAENVGTADSFPVMGISFCVAACAAAIAYGFACGGSLKGWLDLAKQSGHGADFTASHGTGTSAINMGIYGLFIVLYYVLIGAKWNAATVGCVFCMVCCFAKGSHPGNVWPIMAGYVLASLAGKGICMALGTEYTLAINAQAIVIGLCFANGLSPVAGVFGPVVGIFAGMAHYTLVTCVPLMHGGFCLYNGGLTCCILCMLFIPVLETYVKQKTPKNA